MNKEYIDRIFWVTIIAAVLSYFTYNYIKSDNLGPNEVRIGERIYSDKNLSTHEFTNGDMIRIVRNDEEWVECIQMKEPACRIIDDNLSEDWRQGGLLYNYYAISDERGLAPEGWEVMSGEDWDNVYEHISKSHQDMDQFDIYSPSSVVIEDGRFLSLYEGEAVWWIEYSRLITEKPTIVGIRETSTGLEYDFNNVGFDYGLSMRCVKKEKTFFEKIGLSF